MTDDASVANTDRLSMIMTKLERESRFTRILIVACTIANLTVLVFGFLETFQELPATTLTYLLENMDPIMQTQKCLEISHNRRAAAKASVETKPAADKGAAGK